MTAKERVLDYLRDHPDGVPGIELSGVSPRVSLREMEQTDRTIGYSENRWHILQNGLSQIEPSSPKKRPKKRKV